LLTDTSDAWLPPLKKTSNSVQDRFEKEIKASNKQLADFLAY
jgi:hypothetical protein